MELNELISKFESGDVPTGEDFADLIRYCYNGESANFNYGGKFEWRYNEETDSLDLVVLK